MVAEQPKVVLVGPIAVAWDDPREMRYGGVERVAWRLTHVLTWAGCSVVPVAPADSRFAEEVPRRGLWPQASLCRPHRMPPVYAEDAAAMASSYAAHVLGVVQREDPDAVLLLGPTADQLLAIARHASGLLPRCVVALHNGPSDNAALIPVLAAHREVTILALSEIQRQAFADLSDRIEVVLDGIPVQAVPFGSDPAAARQELAGDSAFGALWAGVERPLVSQIDYLHPSKGMLLSVVMFAEAGLADTHDLVLAGGLGWQLPESGEVSVSTIGDRYAATIRAQIAARGLADRVHVLEALTGVQAARLLRASDLVVSPVRMDHGLLWPSATGAGDPESYGQGRAYANAAGVPVLMSAGYDPSFAPAHLPELRFSSVGAGVSALRMAFDRPRIVEMREQVRHFAEQRDDPRPGVRRYVEIVAELAARYRGAVPRVSGDLVDRAVRTLVSREAV